MADFTIKVVNC